MIEEKIKAGVDFVRDHEAADIRATELVEILEPFNRLKRLSAAVLDEIRGAVTDAYYAGIGSVLVTPVKRTASAKDGTYSLPEVRAIIGITKQTSLHWLQDGTLKGVKVGGRWRITPEEVERVLAGMAAKDKQRGRGRKKADGKTDG